MSMKLQPNLSNVTEPVTLRFPDTDAKAKTSLLRPIAPLYSARATILHRLYYDNPGYMANWLMVNANSEYLTS